MITWTSIFPFYEVRCVFCSMHCRSCQQGPLPCNDDVFFVQSLSTRPILLRRWHHLTWLMTTLVSQLCWIFWLSFDGFRLQDPFFSDQILVSTHAPNFGIKWFYSKILHVRCTRSAFPLADLLSYSHKNSSIIVVLVIGSLDRLLPKLGSSINRLKF
jgi:hypothetical protein